MVLPELLFALLAVYLAVKLSLWIKRRRRLIEAIEKLPGPPCPPLIPVFNHATIIVYTDYLQHPLGTFTLIYHAGLYTHKVFPKDGICRYWLGPKPIVILYSPETFESVLTSTTVINKADEYRFFEPWLGEGLVTSKAAKWRFRRKIITPAFHFRILGDFLPIMNQEATKLVQKLNSSLYLKPFDITKVIALCTLDTICETAMGTNINCQADEDSPYVQALHVVGEQALSRVIRPWLWIDSLFYLSEAGRKFEAAKNTMHKFTTGVILERKASWERQLAAMKREDINRLQSKPGANSDKIVDTLAMTFEDLRTSSFFDSGKRRLAFLDLMLHQHLVDKTMTIEDIREEVETFMFAGHDTTAMNISWCLYMLGLHENIQDRVRAEIDEIMSPLDSEESAESLRDVQNGCQVGGQNKSQLAKELKITDVTTEQLRQMKYLDCVIKETLRMWPSIPFVARQMTEDLLVDKKYLIPEGATCMLFTQALHNNPRYYPKPEVFDPDRFLPENSAGRHPFAFVPFSAGPRNCIGQKYAQMEVKVILAKVLRNYYVKTHDHIDKLNIVGELVLRSKNGLNVKLIPRFI